MEAGIGTHIDAPCHLIQGGISTDVLSLENLLAEACVLNVSAKAFADYGAYEGERADRNLVRSLNKIHKNHSMKGCDRKAVELSQ